MDAMPIDMSQELLAWSSQLKTSKIWSDEFKDELYKHAQKLAYEEFNQDDFERQEYDSYSLVLYQHLL